MNGAELHGSGRRNAPDDLPAGPAGCAGPARPAALVAPPFDTVMNGAELHGSGGATRLTFCPRNIDLVVDRAARAPDVQFLLRLPGVDRSAVRDRFARHGLLELSDAIEQKA